MVEGQSGEARGESEEEDEVGACVVVDVVCGISVGVRSPVLSVTSFSLDHVREVRIG